MYFSPEAEEERARERRESGRPCQRIIHDNGDLLSVVVEESRRSSAV